MKIRQGFVSNSSSSSFIIVGFKPTKKQIETANEYEEYDEDGLLYYQEDYDIVGYHWSVSEGDTGTVKPKQILSAEKKLKKIFGDDIDVDVHFGIDFNG